MTILTLMYSCNVRSHQDRKLMGKFHTIHRTTFIFAVLFEYSHLFVNWRLESPSPLQLYPPPQTHSVLKTAGIHKRVRVMNTCFFSSFSALS